MYKKFLFGLSALALLTFMGAGCDFSVGDTDFEEDDFFSFSDEETELTDEELVELEAQIVEINSYTDVEIDVPVSVTKGDELTFTVTVTNSDSKAHSLRSIDVAYDFLDGIYVTGVSPEVDLEYDVDAISQHIFEFNHEIAANSTVDVVFSATAVKTGDFGGDFDICIDGDASCLFDSIRTIVE
jgi:hypothetical protein